MCDSCERVVQPPKGVATPRLRTTALQSKAGDGLVWTDVAKSYKHMTSDPQSSPILLFPDCHLSSLSLNERLVDYSEATGSLSCLHIFVHTMSGGETGKMNPEAGAGLVEGHQLTDKSPSTAPALTVGCYPKFYDFYTHIHTCMRLLKSFLHFRDLKLDSTGACFVLNRARFNGATQSIHFYPRRPPLPYHTPSNNIFSPRSSLPSKAGGSLFSN